ncbi:hypothetical protein HDU76_000616 [Blyttiomyces sp. JEL0837]|nr:hypothetical protein HDU76_000616 [Blyttiomyces sp. JEL0837]
MTTNAAAPAAGPAAADVKTEVRAKRIPRPDKSAHEKELAAIKEKIDTIQKSMSGVQESINGTDNIKGAYDGRRKELRSQIEEINKKKNELNESRSKLLDQRNAIQAAMKKKTEEVKSSKDKLGVKSIAEADQQIQQLEQQLTSGSLKLIDEKRVVTEISNLKKAKKTLETLGTQASSVDTDKQQLDQIREALNTLDPQRKQVIEELDKARAELKTLDEEKRKDLGSLTDLIDKKKGHKAELDALYEKMRTLRNDFKKANDEWYNFERVERERINKERQEQRIKDGQIRIAKAAERELEAAQIPAFTEEITTCGALITFLQSHIAGKPVNSVTAVAAASPLAATNIRKVENVMPDGAVALKKKDDREEEYMVMGGKGKKGKRGQSANTAAPSTPGPVKLPRFDISTMDMFFKLKIDVPTSAADLENTVKALEEKKAKFLVDQAEQTKKNIAAAEAKIAAIRAKAEAGGSVEDAVAELGGDVPVERDEAL